MLPGATREPFDVGDGVVPAHVYDGKGAAAVAEVAGAAGAGLRRVEVPLVERRGRGGEGEGLFDRDEVPGLLQRAGKLVVGIVSAHEEGAGGEGDCGREHGERAGKIRNPKRETRNRFKEPKGK
jgi:hypothetical protein